MKSTHPVQSQRTAVAIVLLLVAVTIAAYWQTFSMEFVTYDDDRYVTKNPHVQAGMTARGIAWAFQSGEATNWHPVTWLSHMLDCQLFGLNAGGHHFTSVLLHAMNGALLFLLLRRLTGTLWRSALVAALFAWHPLHVESVAWIAERKDVLSTLFGLLAIFAYLRFLKARSIVCYGMMLLWFALSLMSKPMLVTLPFVLLLLDFWPLKRFANPNEPGALTIAPVTRSRIILEKLPLLAMSVTSSVITVIVQKAGGAVSSLEAIPLSARLANSVVSYATYLAHMVWPKDMAILYPFSIEIPTWKVVASIIALALISALAILYRRSRPWLLTGWLWYLGMLVPVIGLVQVGEQSRADRYTYVPLIGVFIMLAWSIPAAMRKLAAVPIGVLLVVLFGLTWRQTLVWQNGVTVFEHAISITGDNPIACNNLGAAKMANGDVEGAQHYFDRAIALRPGQASAYNNLGIAQVKLKQIAEAEQNFLIARQLRPGDVQAANNLGMIRLNDNRFDEAIAYFEEALAIRPDFMESLVNCGAAWLAKGDLAQAVSYYQRAVAVNRNSAPARINLGMTLVSQGKQAEGIGHLREAIALVPNDADARVTMGKALELTGEREKAVVSFRDAIAINPNHAGAHAGVAAALIRLDSIEEGMSHFEQSLAINPDDAITHYNYGTALARSGRMDAAIEHLGHAVRLKPDSLDSRGNLANALAAQGRFDEAVEQYHEIIRAKPDHAEAHYNLGNALLAQQKFEQALKEYEEAARLKPDYVDAQFNLGYTLQKLDRREEAIAQYQRVVVLVPNHAQARARLAELMGRSTP